MVNTITVEEAQVLLQSFSTRSKEDQRALCCLLGSYAGDNLGNYNEFSHSITEQELNHAMKMPGNGAHNLIPGQSTDDTELATSMGYGIIENPDPNVFDCNLISKYYTLWLQSPPFDLGMTIGAALGANRREALFYSMSAEECKNRLLAQRNRYSTSQQNRHSQSNGGVMRIAPLCVFLSKQIDQNVIRRIVEAEQSLTHIAKPAIEAAYVYVRLVTNLIKGMTAAQAHEDLTNYFKNECQEEDVKEWWDQKQKENAYDNAVLSMGWIKHALTQCFVALKQLTIIEENFDDSFKQELYKEVLKDILKLCGDSDTNGAIVGGMIGAYLTLSEFPPDYLSKIVVCNLQDKKNPQLCHRRQELYNPRNCIYLCDQLLLKASDNPNIQIIDEKLTEQIINEIKDQNEKKTKEMLDSINKKLQQEKEDESKKNSQIDEENKTESSQDQPKSQYSEQGSILAYFKQNMETEKIIAQPNQNEEINEKIQDSNEIGEDNAIKEEEYSAPSVSHKEDQQNTEGEQKINQLSNDKEQEVNEI